jgi:NAD(P)-dependent dehydrogenase (short-subunit alcohol dehydrogenase family)
MTDAPRVRAVIVGGGSARVACRTRPKARQESAIPIGRVAEREGIARPMAFLASDDASYSTATTFVADGGMMQASVGL